MMDITNSEKKQDGCTAKIVKGETRPSDVLVLFYNKKLTDAQKIKIGINRGYTIPKDFVPIARMMYKDGTLDCGDKMYSIASDFVDPDMKPLSTHPQYEHNPAFKQEYPRRIYKSQKKPVFTVLTEEYVMHMNSLEFRNRRYQRYREEFCPKYLARKRKYFELRASMKFPDCTGPETHMLKGNYARAKPYFLNYEIRNADMKIEYKSIRFAIQNEPMIEKYQNKIDFAEEVSQETIPIVNVKLNTPEYFLEKTSAEKMQEFKNKWVPIIGEMFGRDLPGTNANKEAVRQDMITCKRIREMVIRESEKKSVEAYNALLESIKPVESGEDYDFKITEKLRLKCSAAVHVPSNRSHRSFSIDSERSLRIASPDEHVDFPFAPEDDPFHETAYFMDYDPGNSMDYEPGNSMVYDPGNSMDVEMDNLEYGNPVEFEIQNVEEMLEESDPVIAELEIENMIEIENDIEEEVPPTENINHVETTEAPGLSTTTETFIKDFGNVYLFTASNVEREIEVRTEPSCEESEEAGTISIEATKKDDSEEVKRKKKPMKNSWEEICNDAEDVFSRNSAPQSYVSSTPSVIELEQVLTRPIEKTLPTKSPLITIHDDSDRSSTHSKTKKGRPKKRIRGRPVAEPKKRVKTPPPHPDDDPILRESGPLDFSNIGRKPPGRPRKTFAPRRQIDDLESSFSTTKPHEFPRPDLKRFQKEALEKPNFMMVHERTGEQFARPDINRFVADCAATSLASKRKSVGSQDDAASITSIETEGPEGLPIKLFRKSTDNDDEQNSNCSSTLKSRSLRSRRSYISRNNPKLRHKRTKELSGDLDESSDDGLSRTSSQSWAHNRLQDVNSRTSSLAGDLDDIPWIDRNPPNRLPVVEVTIDEDVEPKPDIDSLPLPPPINPESRKSVKKRRMEKLKKVKEELFDDDDDVIFLRALNKKGASIATFPRRPKEEDVEDEVLPIENILEIQPEDEPMELVMEPVIEYDNPLPRIVDMDQENVTHWFTVNKKTNQELNELFSTDPEVFEDLVVCLFEDTESEGITYQHSVSFLDPTKPHSREFIDFLANSPSDGGVSKPHMNQYAHFSQEFRMRSSRITDNGFLPSKFFVIADVIGDIVKQLNSSLPRLMLISSVERELLSKAESIVFGRYIESILRMASLTSIPWTTDRHISRRFFTLLHGWRQFLKKGGILKVVLALCDKQEERPKQEFIDLISRIVKDCDENLAKAVVLLKMPDEELEAKIAADANLTVDQFLEVRNDMSREKTDKHCFQCSQCKLDLKLNIYFSTVGLLSLHEKLHQPDECTLCYDDCTNVLLHTISKHFSILNDYA